MKGSGWVLRKPFEGKLWPVSLKTHNFCPSEAKDAYTVKENIAKKSKYNYNSAR